MEDGRCGPIAPVVFELDGKLRAKRNASDGVNTPPQSQARVSNFRFGTGRAAGWPGQESAKGAFWTDA